MQRMPPPRVRPPAPAPFPLPSPARNSSSTTTSTTTTTLAPPAPAKSKSAPPASASGSGAVLTRAVYAAGHQRPHPELCPRLGARVRLLVLVTSAPSHRAQRDAIRLTWGHFGARSDVALAFVLGAPPQALQPALAQEDALYGDLVVGNSVDSYSNLTLKSLSLLEWARTYCPLAPHVLKTDDDMFINVPALLAFAAARNATRNTIWGKMLRRSRPNRTPRAKYFLPPQQFAPKLLPDFLTGPAYLLTQDALAPLLQHAPQQPYIRLEDVFVTGVVASAAGVKRVHSREFLNRRASPPACALRAAVSIHMVRFHEQFDLWRRLMDNRTKCP